MPDLSCLIALAVTAIEKEQSWRDGAREFNQILTPLPFV